ncbi:hypothetical protein Tco_1312313 [Tanacetum coccineum]
MSTMSTSAILGSTKKEELQEHQNSSGFTIQSDIQNGSREKENHMGNGSHGEVNEAYMKEVVTRHGVPVSIISNRDGRFTVIFGMHSIGFWEPIFGMSRLSSATERSK